jgi:hypothetical protein
MLQLTRKGDKQIRGAFHQLFGGRFRTDAGFGGFKISVG